MTRLLKIAAAAAFLCLLPGCASASLPAQDPLLDVFYQENPRSWQDDPNPVWSVDRTDCRGFVLRWRARLLAAGVPANEMKIVDFWAPYGRHAVLVVRINGLPYAFDNMARAPYIWFSPVIRDAGGVVLPGERP